MYVVPILYLTFAWGYGKCPCKPTKSVDSIMNDVCHEIIKSSGTHVPITKLSGLWPSFPLTGWSILCYFSIAINGFISLGFLFTFQEPLSDKCGWEIVMTRWISYLWRFCIGQMWYVNLPLPISWLVGIVPNNVVKGKRTFANSKCKHEL